MTGTILNAAGILAGGIAGLTVTRQLSPAAQIALKGLLGVFTVYVGLKMTLSSLGGGFWLVVEQMIILVLALTLGRLTGRLLRLQKFLNRLGQYAKEKFSHASATSARRFSEGFITCTLLFCVGPIAILGALQDGLEGKWETLAIKAVMDGLATITLLARYLGPLLEDRGLLDSLNATGGMLVFCIALVILELKKIELADYLPSLAFAPLLTWLLK